MSVNSNQLGAIGIKFPNILQSDFTSIYQLSSGIEIFFVTAGALKNNYHHFFINFAQLNKLYFASHVYYNAWLVKFEKFDVFEKKSYELVLILNTVERCYSQKLVKFLFRAWQLNL